MSANRFEKKGKTKVEVLSADEYSISMQLTGENGDFFMHIYEVFSGLTITFSDAHIQSVCFEERETKPNDMIEISYCKEGRLECNIHNKVCYLDSGDFVIAQTNGVSPRLYFPLGADELPLIIVGIMGRNHTAIGSCRFGSPIP